MRIARDRGRRCSTARSSRSSVAEVEGVGVRVDRRPPPGLRVGGLARRRRRRRDARRGARQRRRSARPTSATGSPTPADVDGVDAADARPLARRRCSRVPTDEKVALALELERGDAGRRPAHPRRRVGRLRRRRGRGRGRELARRRGRDRGARRARASAFAMAGEGDGDADRLRVLGRPHVRRPRPRGAPRATRPSARCRLLGAHADPRRAGSRWSSTRWSPGRCSALLGARASAARRSLKGRSMFVGREGEEVAAPRVTLVDDPTLADAFGAATHDGEGVPTRRVELIVDGRAARRSCTTCTPRRRAGARHDRVRGARRLQVDARRRRARAAPRARRRSRPRRSWRRCPRRSTCSR